MRHLPRLALPALPRGLVPAALPPLLAACGGAPTAGAGPTAPGQAIVAMAVVESRSGSTLSGLVTFTQLGDTVLVSANIQGASPGKHGFHVHEHGDCSAPDATSAGPHYNPGGVQHTLPGHGTGHPGDLGNVVIGADGKGQVEVEIHDVTLDDGPRSILNRSVVVHEREDDGTQPFGNAGPRQGCGLIKLKDLTKLGH